MSIRAPTPLTHLTLGVPPCKSSTVTSRMGFGWTGGVWGRGEERDGVSGTPSGVRVSHCPPSRPSRVHVGTSPTPPTREDKGRGSTTDASDTDPPSDSPPSVVRVGARRTRLIRGVKDGGDSRRSRWHRSPSECYERHHPRAPDPSQ